MAAKLLSFYILTVVSLGAVQAAPLLDKRQDATDPSVQGALSIPSSVVKLGESVAKPLVQSIGSHLGSEALNATTSLFDRGHLFSERQDAADASVQGALSIPKPVVQLGEDFATSVAKPFVQSVGSQLGSEALNATSSLFKRRAFGKRQAAQGALSIPEPLINLAKPLIEGVGSSLVGDAINATSSLFKREALHERQDAQGDLSVEPFVQLAGELGPNVISDAVNLTKSVLKRDAPFVIDKRQNSTIGKVGKDIFETFGGDLLTGAAALLGGED